MSEVGRKCQLRASHEKVNGHSLEVVGKGHSRFGRVHAASGRLSTLQELRHQLLALCCIRAMTIENASTLAKGLSFGITPQLVPRGARGNDVRLEIGLDPAGLGQLDRHFLDCHVFRQS